LKSYTFTYWFAYPAVSSIQITLQETAQIPEGLTAVLEASKEAWKSGFFMADVENYKLMALKEDSGTEVFGYLEPGGISGVPGWVIRNYLAHIIKKRFVTNANEGINSTNSRH